MDGSAAGDSKGGDVADGDCAMMGIKDRRTEGMWQAKLSGLQTQIDSGRENLVLLEAALQNIPTPEAATQLDTENLVCLGSWQQGDAIPLLPPPVGVHISTLQQLMLVLVVCSSKLGHQ